MPIAYAPRVADAVEELQDLNGTLATQPDRIAELPGAYSAALARAGLDDRGQFADPPAIVEQVAHDLVNAALSELLAQHRAHALLRLAHGGGKIAHPGRVEATRREQRLQPQQKLLVLARELRAMTGQMQPWAIRAELTVGLESAEQRAPQCGRDVRKAHATESAGIDPRLIRHLVVKASQDLQHLQAQRMPTRGQEQKLLASRLDRDRARGQGQRSGRTAAQPHQIRGPRTEGCALDERRDPFAGQHTLDRAEHGEPLGRAATALGCGGVQYPSPADGLPPLGIAHDEAIARSCAKRGGKHELYQCRCPREELCRIERHEVSHPVSGPEMHVHR
ncbi:MAG TPA: hypothetical protein VL220_16715 [Steroidobacteraceae bacterium]|nr:hypothetical protein [Steroidobacteraceae bacterium]